MLSHITEAFLEDGDDFHCAKLVNTANGSGWEKGKAALMMEHHALRDDDFVKPGTSDNAQNAASSIEDDGKLKGEVSQDRPTLGLFYYVIHTILMTGNMYA